MHNIRIRRPMVVGNTEKPAKHNVLLDYPSYTPFSLNSGKAPVHVAAAHFLEDHGYRVVVSRRMLAKGETLGLPVDEDPDYSAYDVIMSDIYATNMYVYQQVKEFNRAVRDRFRGVLLLVCDDIDHRLDWKLMGAHLGLGPGETLFDNLRAVVYAHHHEVLQMAGTVLPVGCRTPVVPVPYDAGAMVALDLKRRFDGQYATYIGDRDLVCCLTAPRASYAPMVKEYAASGLRVLMTDKRKGEWHKVCEGHPNVEFQPWIATKTYIPNYMDLINHCRATLNISRYEIDGEVCPCVSPRMYMEALTGSRMLFDRRSSVCAEVGKMIPSSLMVGPTDVRDGTFPVLDDPRIEEWSAEAKANLMNYGTTLAELQGSDLLEALEATLC